MTESLILFQGKDTIIWIRCPFVRASIDYRKSDLPPNMVKKKMDLSALMLIKDELFYTGEQLN
jgi:hypothetical protein